MVNIMQINTQLEAGGAQRVSIDLGDFFSLRGGINSKNVFYIRSVMLLRMLVIRLSYMKIT